MAWAFVLYPEEPLKLTIENAIERALENNYSYRISQEQVNQYKKRLMQSLVFLPRSVSTGKNYERKAANHRDTTFFPRQPAEKVTLDFTKNYEFRFQLVQPIFTGGKLLYTYKNARLDLDLAREKEKNSRAETILDVKKMFFNILVLKELLKAQEESLALLENNYTNVKARSEQGMASKFDLLRAELAVSSMKPKYCAWKTCWKSLSWHLNPSCSSRRTTYRTGGRDGIRYLARGIGRSYRFCFAEPFRNQTAPL